VPSAAEGPRVTASQANPSIAGRELVPTLEDALGLSTGRADELMPFDKVGALVRLVDLPL
jgi:hypothetical protein